MASANAGLGGDILIVIDVQRCFIQGGTLGGLFPEANMNNTGKRMNGKKFTELINKLIKTNKFSDVVFTKDVHSLNHKSFKSEYTFDPATKKATHTTTRIPYDYIEPFGPGGGYVILGVYTPSENRTWKDAGSLSSQFLWPDHCIKSTPANNSSKKINKAMNGKNDGPALTAEESASLLVPISNNANGRPKGHTLAYDLSVYEDANRPADVTSNIHIVEKGFEQRIDSYSAIADAEGNFTPTIKYSTTPAAVGTKLIDALKAKNPANIYICGIARDFCVYWSALDILNFFIPRNLESHTVHFLYDLTKAIFPKPLEAFNTEISNDITTLQTKQSTINFKLHKGFTIDSFVPVLEINSNQSLFIRENNTVNALPINSVKRFVAKKGGRRHTKKQRRSHKHGRKTCHKKH